MQTRPKTPDTKGENWWNRPGGGMEVIYLAVPMIISSGSIALMQFTDRVFLTWYDTAAMGAAFSAGNLLWFFAALPFGIAGYTNAFVSQYNGSNQYSKIGAVVWQGIFLGLALMPIILLLSPWYSDFFRLFNHGEHLVQLETTYLYYLLWGFGAIIGTEAVCAFFCGLKKMKTVMTVNVVFVLVNVVLDYILIFGINGHFAWGLAGAAIATTIAQWFRFLTLIILMFWEDREYKYRIGYNCRFQWKPFAGLCKYGSMSGVQFVVDVVCFSLFTLFMGMIGERENAATAIAFTLNTLIFLPILGAGVAVVTLVGNYLGEDRPDLAKRATMTALTIGTVITGFFVSMFLFFPDVLLSVYARSNPEEFEPLRQLTIVLLRFIAIYLFFDTISIIFCSAIKGAGDTKFVMLATCVISPAFITLVGVGLIKFNGGLYWAWAMADLWVMALGLAYSIRFVQGKWMNMRL